MADYDVELYTLIGRKKQTPYTPRMTRYEAALLFLLWKTKKKKSSRFALPAPHYYMYMILCEVRCCTGAFGLSVYCAGAFEIQRKCGLGSSRLCSEWRTHAQARTRAEAPFVAVTKEMR